VTPAAMGGNRTPWIVVLSVLSVATVANLAWTFREALLADGEVRRFLEDAGLREPAAGEPFHDLQTLHLVSRDMHRHPQRAGMLALSIVFVNRAGREQPYPSIEVTLTDAANRPLAHRLFEPAEYLQGGRLPGEWLPPDVHVPVLLEFTDPDGGAVGYELNFR